MMEGNLLSKLILIYLYDFIISCLLCPNTLLKLKTSHIVFFHPAGSRTYFRKFMKLDGNPSLRLLEYGEDGILL